jgi:heme A synthase
VTTDRRSSTVRKVFALLAPVFLAASGAFDTAPNDESFQPHRALGYGIVLFAVLLTILAAVARAPGRLIGLTGLVAGLGVLQGLIRSVAAAFDDTGGTSTTAGTVIFGLHAVNALAIMAVAGTVARRARVLARPAPAAARTTGAASPAPAAGPIRPAL